MMLAISPYSDHPALFWRAKPACGEPLEAVYGVAEMDMPMPPWGWHPPTGLGSSYRGWRPAGVLCRNLGGILGGFV